MLFPEGLVILSYMKIFTLGEICVLFRNRSWLAVIIMIVVLCNGEIVMNTTVVNFNKKASSPHSSSRSFFYNVFVYMYVYILCMYTCMHACIYVCIKVCMCYLIRLVYVRVSLCMWSYVFIFVPFVCMNLHLYVFPRHNSQKSE